MSGYKKALISISEEEYRRLHEADMERRFQKVERKNNRELNELKRLNADRLADLEARQQAFLGSLEAVHSQVNSLEDGSQQEFIRQQEEFNLQLSTNLEALWEGEDSIKDILQQFQEKVASDSHQRQSHLHRIEALVHDLGAGQRSKHELAASWLASAQALGRFIGENFEYDRFAPGELERLSAHLDLVENDLAQGLPEAALGLAQAAYQDLSGLHLKLEQSTADFLGLYQSTRLAASDLYETMRQSAAIPALDLEGRETGFSLQLNYWSGGGYAALVDRLKRLILHTRSAKDSISREELVHILGTVLPGIKAEFEELVCQARLAAINSQVRVNIADFTLQALEKQGFFLQGSGYVQNDRRKAYILELCDREGASITIEVDPTGAVDLANDLVIESHDHADRTGHELVLRSRAVARALQGVGLRVGRMDAHQPAALPPAAAGSPRRVPRERRAVVRD